MKKLSLIFGFILLALAGKAQTVPYDTVPYVLDYHSHRIALFKKEPMTQGKIIFLGNSITEFGDWKKRLKDPTIINRGIAGDITFGVLGRLDEVITHQPSKLFIEIGINDISKNIPDTVVIENILAIVRRVEGGSPTTQIFVQSILPTNNSVKTEFPDAMNKGEHIIMVNTQLSQCAKKMGFTFIDLFTKFLDKDGKLDVRYTVDGLHPNAAGYRLWVQVLKEGKYL